MKCPKGTLLNAVKWTDFQGTLQYYCFPMTYIGSCFEWVTPSIVATEEGLRHARISCPSPDMGLQEVTLTNAAFVGSSGSLNIRYRYTSTMAGILVTATVELDGIYAAIPFETAFATDFATEFAGYHFIIQSMCLAGVYCPHVRDESGRLRYESVAANLEDERGPGLFSL
eukprot:s249_g17.t1